MVYSIGTLIFAGIYLMLSLRLWKVIIGSVFLSHAVNLTLLVSGGHGFQYAPPILDHAKNYMDPLPQALILTAIVISFGVTAFILIVLRQVYIRTGTTNLYELETREWEESDHHE